MQSKYSEIIIDKSLNSVNNGHNIILTAEQLYDIMHHTHNAEDIIGAEESDQTINELKNEVASLKQAIEELQDTIGTDLTDYDIDTPGVQDINGNTIAP